MSVIKALITDFDGTLVDTWEANYNAYKTAFAAVGYTLTPDTYRECFGLRYDKFVERLGLTDQDLIKRVKELKAMHYPDFFHLIRVNRSLLSFLRSFHAAGGKIAIASTARRNNLTAVLSYIGATDMFDLVLSGESVVNSKPNPEIYLKVLELLSIDADSALCFEDSDIGVKAAETAGLKVIKINNAYYGN